MGDDHRVGLRVLFGSPFLYLYLLLVEEAWQIGGMSEKFTVSFSVFPVYSIIRGRYGGD